MHKAIDQFSQNPIINFLVTEFTFKKFNFFVNHCLEIYLPDKQLSNELFPHFLGQTRLF